MKKQIEVFDDFLNEEDYENITETITNMPWRWNNTILEPDEEQYGNGQFTHLLFLPEIGMCSDYYGLYVTNFQVGYQNKNPDYKAVVLSAKINLNPMAHKSETLGGFHTDWSIETPLHKTMIWYYNTNNGATEFETGERIDSVANRLVVFDGSIKHTGISCTDAPHRIVLNINCLLVK